MRKYNSVQKVLSSTLAISPLLSSARLFYSPFLFCSLPSSVLLILGVAESFTESALAGSQTEDYCEPASPIFSPFFSPLLCSAPLCHPLPVVLPSSPLLHLFYSALILPVLLYCTLLFPSPLHSLPCPLFSSLLLSFFPFSCIFLLRLAFSFSTLFVIQFSFFMPFHSPVFILICCQGFCTSLSHDIWISLWRRQGFSSHGS